jgi:T-complex protein 1 subunit gamma
MRRKIENPRVVLLDGSLEYKKGESQTNLELSKEDDWATVLQMEEEEIKRMCDDLLRFDPDVVVVEKGVSDLAQHFLMKKNVSVLRRARKTDNNRISRVTGATIVNRPDELQETDVGTKCGLFEVRKIGDDYFAFFEEC